MCCKRCSQGYDGEVASMEGIKQLIWGIAIIFIEYGSFLLNYNSVEFLKLVEKIVVLDGNVKVYFLDGSEINDIIFGRKLAKGTVKENYYVPPRDLSYEKKVYKWSIGIYFGIIISVYVILAIAKL